MIIAPYPAMADPTGGVVVGGAATITQAGPITTIDQATDRAVINWQGFSIAPGELTQFNMPSVSSAVLNRVTGGDASSILGALQANGQVYLINPNGILFGAGAQVHVGGLVASTLDVPNAQFMQGGDLLFSGDSTASVVNYGNIRAVSGDVYMIGRNVENHGMLSAPNGTVGLAGGDSVLLIDGANQRLVVQPSAKGGTVSNTGTIEGIRAELLANGGNVYALAINNEGNVRATGAEITPEGRVLLKANGGLVVNTGQLAAKNADGSGGEVVVDSGAGGTTELSGEVDVSGASGGTAQILGHDVTLDGANVNADATGAGDGGRVVVSADGAASIDGTVTARGGPSGGDGGFVELSGLESLSFLGHVDTTAPLGQTGQLLLDPTDYLINADAADAISLNLNTTNVEIRTSDGGTNLGNVVFQVGAQVNWTSNNDLSVFAHNAVTFANGSGITHTAGSGNLLLRADSDADGAGTVQFFGSGAQIVFSGSSGNVAIQYNPTGYASPTDYSGNVAMGSGALIAQMLVNNVTDLQNMNQNLAGNYALGADVDASATSGWDGGAGFAPVGSWPDTFTGTFDGQGHVIEGLVIYRPSTNEVGLFGYIWGATIRDVGLVDADVTGYYYVGALVGVTANSSAITNAYGTGSVTGNYEVGGLVGRNSYNSTITNAYATGSVTGVIEIGGLVGRNEWSTITNAYATGSVSGNNYVGGLVGYNGNSSTITDAYASGSVSGSSYVGGFAGGNSGTITSGYFDATVNPTLPSVGTGDATGVAGLLGDARFQQASYAGFDFANDWYMIEGETRPFLRAEYDTTVRNAHQLQLMAMDLDADYVLAGDIDMSELANPSGMWTTRGFVPIGNNSTRFTGSFDGQGHVIEGLVIDRPSTYGVGLFGYTGGATIHDVGLVNADFTGNYYVGGLVGFSQGSTITNAYATGSVAGYGSVGGLVGRAELSAITNAYATGNVAGSYHVGGLVGLSEHSTITNAYATGTVTANQYVGGLVGYSYNYSTIANAYATGSITGNDYVGGLVGDSYNYSAITNAYATGSVTGVHYYVGGLVGKNDFCTISNAYATGSVTGNSYVGGLVGYNGFYSTITYTYATGSVTGTNYVGGFAGANNYTITRGYFDTTVNPTLPPVGAGDATGVTGLSGDARFQQASHTGFDFTNNWYMIEGQTRPFLRAEYGTTVRNAHQLQLMAMDLDADYVLAGDIDMSELLNPSGMWTTRGFVPIGTNLPRFTGSLDGQGHVIEGLVIDRPSTNYVGLFGWSDGTIHDVGLVNADVTGNYYVGGLVGYNYYSAITDAFATGSVTGYCCVGGLVGYNGTFSTITNAYATGSVTGTESVGGLVGYGYYSTITNAYATGSVAGTDSVGGLVGYNHYSSTITDAYAAGSVAGSYYVGGLVGYNYYGSTITDAYATGSVAGSYYVGGLVGNNHYSSITDAYATGSVTGDNYVGGLVGFSYYYAPITNAYATGSVTGGDQVGGLVGVNQLSSIDRSYSSSNVDATGANGIVGGLVGLNGGTITRSYASGTYGRSTANTGGYAGGLVGLLRHDDLGSGASSVIRNCYSVADFSGGSFTAVGGLVGRAQHGTGYSPYPLIEYSYSAGTLPSTGQVGGILGSQEGILTTNYLFWDYEVAGLPQTQDRGGTFPDLPTVEGLTTALMKQQTTFTAVGWDFASTWHMINGATYPLLQYQPLPGTPLGGIVFSDAGLTPVGAGYGVSLAIDGAIIATTQTDASGVYTFLVDPTLLDDTGLIVYLDDEALLGASGYHPVGNSLTDLDIYAGTLIARSNDPMSNALFGQAGTSALDTDIPYVVTTAAGLSSLTLDLGIGFLLPGGNDYTLDGNITATGAGISLQGNATAVASVVLAGNAVEIAGVLDTAGNSLTLDAGTGPITTTGPISAGGGAISFISDTISLGAAIQGTSTVLLRPYSPAQPIYVGTGANGYGGYALDDAEIARLVEGFSEITIGGANSAGGLSVVGPATFRDTVRLQSPAGGAITVASQLDNLGSSNSAYLSLTAPRIDFNANTFSVSGISAQAIDLTAGAGNDITVASGVTVRSLTAYYSVGLLAGDNVVVQSNGTVTSGTTSGGGVYLRAGYQDTDGIGQIQLAGNVEGYSSVELYAIAGAVQTGGSITGGRLYLGGSGSFQLTSPTNQMAELSAYPVNGAITYVDSNALRTNAILTYGSPINISTVNGPLTVGNTNVTYDIDAGAGTLTLTAGSIGNDNFLQFDYSAGVLAYGGVDLIADNVNTLYAYYVVAPDGVIHIRPYEAGTAIALGGNDAAGVLGLSTTELSKMYANTLRVGDSTSGNITVTSPINTGPSTYSLITGGQILQNSGATISRNSLALSAGGMINLGQNNNVSYLAATSSGGSISYNNVGGLTISNVDDVYGLTTNGAMIDIRAGGGIGVVNNISSGGGAISLYGGGTIGLAANLNSGIGTTTLSTTSGGVNQTAGTLSAAKLLLLGSGGPHSPFSLNSAANNVGTLAANISGGLLSFIDVNGFSVDTVDGYDGINAPGQNVELAAGNLITLSQPVVGSLITLNTAAGGVNQVGGSVTGSTLALSGAGTFNLPSATNNVWYLGADVQGALTYVDADRLYVSAIGGIPSNGVATGNFPASITTINGYLDVLPTRTVDAGNATVYLEAGGAGNTLTIGSNATVRGLAGATLVADRMTIDGSVLANNGTALLHQYTDSRPIQIGGSATGALLLTPAEINRITAAMLKIGNHDSGAIMITEPIYPAGTSVLSFESGSHVTQNSSGWVNVAQLAIRSGGNVVMNYAPNNVDTFSAVSLGGAIAFANTDSFTVGQVDGVPGVYTLNQPISLRTIYHGSITVLDTTRFNGADVDAGTSTVVLEAMGNDYYVSLATGSSVRGDAGVTIIADEMSLGGTVAATAGTVLLRPYTGGQFIYLGGTTVIVPGNLVLSGPEINRITAGILKIGSSSSGQMTVIGPITPAGTNTLSLETGATLGDDDVYGGHVTVANLALRAGTGIGWFDPLNVTVDRLAAQAAGKIDVANSTALTVATVDSLPGVTTIANDGQIRLTVDGSLTVSQPITPHGNGGVDLLSTGSIYVDANVLAAGSGNVNLVAGWDGTTGLASPFDMSLVLADADTYGNDDGRVRIGNGSQTTGIAVGSRLGATQLAADGLSLIGSGYYYGYAQLGFADPNRLGADASITVRLHSDLTALAGSAYSYVQVGHGGYNSNASHSGTIDVVIDTPGGLISFEGGTRSGAYAQLGHGGYYARSNQGGTIHVDATGGSIQFQGGSDSDAYAQLGHGGDQAYGDHSGTIDVDAANSLITFQGGVYSHAQLGHGGYYAIGNHGGTIDVYAPDASINFRGGNSYGYAQLGHGGWYAYGDHSGTIAVYAPRGTINFEASTTANAYHAYAQLGHGGTYAYGNHSGVIDIDVSDGSISFKGGSYYYDYAQLGHGGYSADGNHSGTIDVDATGGSLSFEGGLGQDAYAQLGHGGDQTQGNHSGTIDVDAAGATIDFRGGGDYCSYAQLGHGGTYAYGNHSGIIDVYAPDASINFRGGRGYGYAQLGHGGYYAVGDHSGNIDVYAPDASINFRGGDSYGYAQLGHGGYYAYGDHSGTIAVYTPGGTINFEASTTTFAYYAYAQLGHGGTYADGNHSGAIDIDVSDGSISFKGGSYDYSYAQLGHGGFDADGNHSGAIDVDATGGSISFEGGSYYGDYAQLGHGGYCADGNHSGAIDVDATGGSISFEGGSYYCDYAQLGHGGYYAVGNHSGNIDVYAPDASISFEGGSYYYAYAQLGHGGYYAGGNHSGAIDVDATGGSISFEGGSYYYTYAQLGHGGTFANGNHDGTISLDTADLFLAGGADYWAYAQIGHGDAIPYATGTRQGAIDITVTGETSLVNGGGTNAVSWIGHRTGSTGGISNADVTLLSGTLDYSGTATSTLFDVNAALAANMAANMAGGNVTLAATNTTPGDTGGMTVGGTFSYSSTNTLSFLSTGELRFVSPVQNAAAGTIYGVAGWDGAITSPLAYPNVADLEVATTISNAGSGAQIYLYAGGSIVDTGTLVASDELILDAVGSIGSDLAPLSTSVNKLAARAGGGIYIDNATSLEITALGTPTITGVTTTDGDGPIELGADSGSITVNELIAADGSGNVTLAAPAGSIVVNSGGPVSSGSGDIHVTAGQSVTLEDTVDTGGSVYLTAEEGGVSSASGADVTAGPLVQIDAGAGATMAGTISADVLRVLGAGTFTINNPANTVATLVGNLEGGLWLANSTGLTVGDDSYGGLTTLGGDVCLQLDGPLSITHAVDLTGTSTDGTLRINATDEATQSGDGTIRAYGVGIRTDGRALFALDGNDIDVLAADTGGHALRFDDADGYAIGTICDTSGGCLGGDLIGLGNVTNACLTLTEINAPIVASGTLRVRAPSGLTQSGSGTISADALAIDAGGAVLLPLANDVNTLAVENSSGGAAVRFNDVSGLTIGAVSQGSNSCLDHDLVGIATEDGNVSLSTAGLLEIAARIAAGDANVTLRSTGGADQTGGRIVAEGLRLLGEGQFTLARANNAVETIAADIDGQLSFTNGQGLVVGRVGDLRGIRTTDGDVCLKTLSPSNTADLAIRGTIDAGAGTIRLNVAGEIRQSDNPDFDPSVVADRIGIISHGDAIFDYAAGNDVNMLAADADEGNFRFDDADGYAIGRIHDTPGSCLDGDLIGLSNVTNACLTLTEINAPIVASGTLRVRAPFGLTQSGSGTISADALGIDADGAVLLPLANEVNTLAVENSSSGAAVRFNDVSGLTVGAVSQGSNSCLDHDLVGIATEDGNVSLSTAGLLEIAARIAAGSANVTLRSIGGADQTGGRIVAEGLRLLGEGPFTLTRANNAVETIAADIDGRLSFTNGQGLVVGRVGDLRGIRTTDGDVCLKTLSPSNTADLAIRGTIDAGAGTIRLNVAGEIRQSDNPDFDPSVVADRIGIVSHGDAIFDYAAGNDVNTLAADTNGGDFRFDDADGYAIGAVSADGCCFDANLIGLTADDACVTVTTINRRILSTGTVRILAPWGLTQDARIEAIALGIDADGDVILLHPNNDVDVLAVRNLGPGSAVQFNDRNDLEIGAVSAGGCFADAVLGILTNGGDVAVTAGRTLTLSESIATDGSGNVYLAAEAGSVSSVSGADVSAGPLVQIDAGAGATMAGTISADVLRVLGAGTFTINNPANTVATLVGDIEGGLWLANSTGLTVGDDSYGGLSTLGGDVCLQLDGPLSITHAVDLTGTAGDGTLRIHTTDEATQSGGGTIRAYGVGIRTDGRALFALDGNDIDVLAADTNGHALRFDDADGYAIGTICDTSGGCLGGDLIGLGNVTSACLTLTEINAPINASGTLRVRAPFGLTQSGSGTISADALAIEADGDVILLNPNNDVDVLAVRNVGAGSVVRYRDRNGLEIGTVSAGGCLAATVRGILTNDGDVAVRAGGTLTLSALIATELTPIPPAGGTVRLSAGTIVDHNDMFIPVANVIAGAVHLTADTGIGQSSALGAIDVNADAITALNATTGGVYLTSTRIGGPVEFASIMAQGTGDVRLLAVDDAVLTDVQTEDGAILATSLGSLAARRVAAGNNNDVVLAAFDDVRLGKVSAGDAATGGMVTVTAGGNVVDQDGGDGEDVRGSQVHLLAGGDIGGPGPDDSIEVRTSVVNAAAGGGVYVTAVNTARPVEFANVISLCGGDVELRSRVDTTYGNVGSWGGDVRLLVRDADVTARHVFTTDDGRIWMETVGPNGGQIGVVGNVSTEDGDLRIAAVGNVVLDAGQADRPVSVTSQTGSILVTGRNLVVRADRGYDATVGAQHGDTAVVVEENVTVHSGLGIARIGSNLADATGNIMVWAETGDVSLIADSDRAAIGHALGTGNVVVVAGKDLALESLGGGPAQIGHDALPGAPNGDSNVIVAWDQLDSANDGGGRLTMTTNTAITGHGSPNEVRLFGTRRLGNSIAPGAVINGHPYSGYTGLYPTPPGEPGTPFGLNVEFLSWDYEQWNANGSLANFLADPGAFPYAGEFAFFYVDPGLSPGEQPQFFNFLYGTDYDRFIRTQDWARTIEQWLLGYGQPTVGSITVEEGERPEEETAGSGTGGVNAQTGD